MNVDRRLDLIEERLNRLLDSAAPYAPVEIVRAKVTTGISEGTFASPSSDGEAQIYRKNAEGTWVESGDPEPVRNQFGGGLIAVGASVLLGEIDGEWFVIAADCPGDD